MQVACDIACNSSRSEENLHHHCHHPETQQYQSQRCPLWRRMGVQWTEQHAVHCPSGEKCLWHMTHYCISMCTFKFMTVNLQVYNASQEIETAAKYPLIRLFTASLVSSSVPVDELLGVEQQWSVAGPSTSRTLAVTIMQWCVYTQLHYSSTCSNYQWKCLDVLLSFLLVLWPQHF